MKEKKNNRFRQLETRFKEEQLKSKEKIKQEPNHLKRFFKWIVYLVVFPWKWLAINIRDWRTGLIFGLTFIVLSSEVWVPYLIAFITKDAWWFGIGSACWLFWAAPGTPFLVICIGFTIIIKGFVNRIHKGEKEEDDNNGETESKG